MSMPETATPQPTPASSAQPASIQPPKAPTPDASRPAWPATALAFLLAAWVAFTFAFTPLRTSHDEWWHLKTGRYIAEHGLPVNEIFTATAEQIPWHNHEWLAQLLLWKIFAATGSDAGDEYAGLLALITFKSIVIVLAFAGFGLALARRMREPVWAALAAAVAAALARRTFYFRPPFISYLLLALLLGLFIAWRAGRMRARWLWLAVPLFALWTNLHGGWMAGLLIVSAFWADQAWRTLRAWLAARRGTDDADAAALLRTDPLRSEWRALLMLTALGVGCVAGTLGNPYGWQLYALAGNVLSDAYLVSAIGELAPPDLRYVWVLEGSVLLMAAVALRPASWRGLLGCAAALAGLHLLFNASSNPWLHTAVALPVYAAAIARTRAPGALAHALLICFFAYQGIHHVRHLSLLAVMLLPSLAWGLEAWALHAATRGRSLRTLRLAGLGALAVLAAFWIFGGALNRYESVQRLLAPRMLEGSAFQRNLALLRGARWEPGYAVNLPGSPGFNPRLPQGRFLVEGYPEQAVNFLLRARLPAPLWNGGNYAGYLIWRLAPERMKVFTDNRYDIYGGRFIREEHAVRNGWTRAWLDAQGLRPEDGWHAWDEVLERWNIQTLFVEDGEPINGILPPEAWTRVYEGFGYTLWVRNTPANRETIDRALTLTKPHPFEAMLAP